MDEICTQLVPWTPPPVQRLDHSLQNYSREWALPEGGDIRRLGYMARDFLTFFGPERDITTIDRDAGRAYARKRIDVDGMMTATPRREPSILRAVLGHAKREGRIKEVPSFWMPPASPPRVRWLTKDEYRALMQVPMLRSTKMFFLLAFQTGARTRAIEELVWDRVDLTARTIDYRVPGVRYKNKRRVVAPINDTLFPRLEQAFKRPDRGEYVIGCNRKGLPLDTYKKCKAALLSVGITDEGTARHVARHTFESWRLQAGVSIYVVAKLVGDTVMMIEKTYGHMNTEHLMEAANAV